MAAIEHKERKEILGKTHWKNLLRSLRSFAAKK
jgi:hypothetical protein